MWSDFRRRKCQPVPVTVQFTNRPIWLIQLEEWWSSWWQADGNTNWYFKKRHVVLVGPPNAGKTTAAKRIAGTRRPFIPSSNRDFCLSGLCNEDFDYVLWDDFEFSLCNRRTLLCLMQGDITSIDVKCQPAYHLVWQKPIIFTTNFLVEDEAFNARAIIIHCTDPLIIQ